MNILAFDTSFAACSAAAGRGLGSDRAAQSAIFERMQTGHAERLVPMIGEALDTVGLGLGDVEVVAIASGPGSFTGSRIAVAAARAFALALKTRTVAATSLEVMAEQATDLLAARAPDGRPGALASDLVIVMDARAGEVYAQRFHWRAGGGAEAAGDAMLTSLDGAARLGGQRSVVTFCGSAAAAVAARAGDIGREAHARLADLLPDARYLLRLAERLAPLAEPPKPLYLRPADAKPQAGKSIERVAK